MFNEMKKRVGQAKMVGMANPKLGAGILLGKKKLAKPNKPMRRQMTPPPMPDPSTIKNNSKPVFPKPPAKPVKRRSLEQSMDMGVQKGLKNFRNR